MQDGQVSRNALAASALTHGQLANWPLWLMGHPVGFLWSPEIHTPPWGCSSDSPRGIRETGGGCRPGWLGRVSRTTRGPWWFSQSTLRDKSWRGDEGKEREVSIDQHRWRSKCTNALFLFLNSLGGDSKIVMKQIKLRQMSFCDLEKQMKPVERSWT